MVVEVGFNGVFEFSGFRIGEIAAFVDGFGDGGIFYECCDDWGVEDEGIREPLGEILVGIVGEGRVGGEVVGPPAAKV